MSGEGASWHEQDLFWETVPMFGQRLWEQAPGEVEQVLALVPLQPGAAVLDLPCGAGRHSLELARRGFRVTGVDRTAAYLDEARARAAAEGLDVEWVKADIREFVRPGAFDLAINLFTSFGYFEDPAENERALKNLAQSLRPGGALVMEMMGKEVLARIFQPRDWQELPDGTLYLQERSIARDWTWIDNRWILLKDGRQHEFHVGHQLYDAAGLRAMMIGAGLGRVAMYGGLDGRPYDRDAQRLVAVANK
jgi:SAM-dependent methyltransferase